MKCRLLFFLLFIFDLSNAQYRIQGKVIDAETQKPLEGVSVFLSHSTNGTITNDKGDFQLNYKEQGKYELVITSLNYEDCIVSVQTIQSVESLVVKLKPAATLLKDVVVEPYDKNGWAKWKDSFNSYFIGSTQLAKNCILVNPEVVKFRYNSNTNKLRAFTNEKLIFENRDLGYRIIYLLSKFEIDFNNNTFYFKGNSLFEELKFRNAKEMVKWNKLRNETYKGSLRHFMRSLYQNQLVKDGFEVRRVKFITREEEYRVKNALKQFHEKNDKSGPDNLKIDKDSMDYYLKVKKLAFDENRLTLNTIIPRDSVVSDLNDPNSKSLYFNNYLEVRYLKKRNPTEYAKTLPKYRSSEFIQTDINLRFNNPITIYQNGNFYNGLDLLIDGYWAWFEKISTMLPTDYTPAK
jgi:CarboxypepD_reg-like domain